MAFDIKDKDITFITSEFENILAKIPNEFLGIQNEIFRFRLFELIFLERCALYE